MADVDIEHAEPCIGPNDWTIAARDRPQGIVVDAKANRIYVANVHGDSVSAIDGARNAVIGTLRTGKNPLCARGE